MSDERVCVKNVFDSERFCACRSVHMPLRSRRSRSVHAPLRSRGPHGGVELVIGVGRPVRLHRCGRRTADRGGSRRLAWGPAKVAGVVSADQQIQRVRDVVERQIDS